MAVTGIANGYNMYMNPYGAGSMGKPADAAVQTGSMGAAKDAAADRIPAEDAGLRAGRIAPGGRENAAAGSLWTRMPVPAGTDIPLLAGSGSREGTSPADFADPDAQKKIGRKSSPEECQTCKERKYQDGSDENVSFKAAAHISPEAAGAAVRAHEGEHVSNAYKEAQEKGGKVVNASVMIHTAICPECGRTYVSGGTTSTTIRYSKGENPYREAQKAQEAIRLRGKNIDYAA